jgi:hypothetical protein
LKSKEIEKVQKKPREIQRSVKRPKTSKEIKTKIIKRNGEK